MWKRLNHPNIVPFKGVTFEPLQLVSEWMDCGELREYLRTHSGANLISLVSLFCHRPVFIGLQKSPHPVISRLVLQMVSFTFTHAIWFMGISKECVELHKLTNSCLW